MMPGRWISVLAVLGLLLTACSPAAAPAVTPPPQAPAAKAATPASKPTIAPAVSPTPKATADQPRNGGALTLGTGGDPPSLDPHQETTQYTLGPVAPSYNSLIQYDPLAWPEAKIVSDLAESWQISPEGTLYTFRLPKGIAWHDGSPLTSADVKFTLERIKDPPRGTRSPRSGLFQVIDRVDAPDAETVAIRLKYANASFLPTLAMGWNVVVQKNLTQQKGDLKKDVVGTGPFKYKSYAAGVSYDSVKNSDYFRKGRPYLDAVRWFIIKDAGTRLSALRTGRVLMIPPVPGIGSSDADTLEKASPNIASQKKAITATISILFNMKTPPWGNAKVRQAANIAFDREAAITAAMQGRGVMGGLLYPSGEWARPTAELAKKPGYQKPGDAERAQARKLLAEAGFADGFKSTITTRQGFVESERPAELFKAEMAKVGIDMTIDVKESTAYYDTLEKRSFQTASLNIGLQLDDPDAVFPEMYTTKAPRNYMGYSDPKVDELEEKASRTMDKAERLKLVRQMEDIVMEANPALIAMWLIRIAAHSRDVRNYKVAPGMGFNNMMQEVWLAR